jgi:type I restriction enzyme S subunit
LLYSFKLSVGTVSFAGKDMFTNEAIASFLAHALLPLDYLFYALPEFVIKNASTNIYGAAILNQELIRDAYLLAPTYSEAEQIAAFLDHETAKIDRLIEKQQGLIALLKEKRQAVISHAVTQGLNPHAPVKDSGIEWLGQVPAHWEVSYIKYNATLAGRIGFRGYTTDDLVDEGAGAITLSPSNFDGGNLTFEKKTYISWRKYHESPEIKLQAEDIVMVKTGSTLGKIGFVDCVAEPMTINPQVVIFKNVKLSARFLFYFLGSPLIQSNVRISNTGGTMPTMTQECIGNYPVLVPPESEQDAIVANLSERCGKVDILLNKTETALTLLQERRTALISAAVTGKIDVRAWQPPAN